MWEFLIGMFIGDAVGKSPLGRFVRPALALFALGLIIAALIYAAVVLKAISERSEQHHVHAHSTR
jgi:hypothetical protein